jgi:hypothetical protein
MKVPNLKEQVRAELLRPDRSLSAIEKACGVSYDTLRRLRNGDSGHDIAYDKVQRLAEFLLPKRHLKSL